MSDVDLFHGKGQLAPVQLLPRTLQGDLSDEYRIEQVDTPAPWLEFFSVALKKWRGAEGILPESVTDCLEPMILDALSRFPDVDATQTKPGKELLKRLSQKKVPIPMGCLLCGDVFSNLVPLLQAWLGISNTPVKQRTKFCTLPLQEFVADKLRNKDPFTLLSTPTHHFGWIDPTTWVERVAKVKDFEAEVHPLDWALSLLRLSPQKRSSANKMLEDISCPVEVESYLRVALDPKFDPAKAEGDPRIILAASRARNPLAILPKSWTWADEVRGPDSRIPADFVWNFPDDLDPSYPEIQVSITSPETDALKALAEKAAVERFSDLLEEQLPEQSVALDDFVLGLARFKARDIIKYVPDDALPPVSLFDFADDDEPMYLWEPGITWNANSLASVRPGNLDWLWTKVTPCFIQRDVNKDSNGCFPEALLSPLRQPGVRVTRSVVRLLWIGWTNRAERLKDEALAVTSNVIETDRFDPDLFVDTFEEMSHSPWWSLKRITGSMIFIGGDSPLSLWRMVEVGEGVLKHLPCTTRNYSDLAEFVVGGLKDLGLPASEAWLEQLAESKNAKLKAIRKRLADLTDSPTKCRKEALELQKKARQKIEEKVKRVVR